MPTITFNLLFINYIFIILVPVNTYFIVAINGLILSSISFFILLDFIIVRNSRDILLMKKSTVALETPSINVQ